MYILPQLKKKKKKERATSSGLELGVGVQGVRSQGSSFEQNAFSSIAQIFPEYLLCVRPAERLYRGFRD